MIGREAYDNAYMLSQVDRFIFADDAPQIPRKTVLKQLLPYIDIELNKGTRLHHITRHVLGIFHGLPGARQWRRQLSQQPPIGLETLEALIESFPERESV
jgi:tRNA-dihydrouridine synthase A